MRGCFRFFRRLGLALMLLRIIFLPYPAFTQGLDFPYPKNRAIDARALTSNKNPYAPSGGSSADRWPISKGPVQAPFFDPYQLLTNKDPFLREGKAFTTAGLPCVVTCPPGAIPEGEACGSDINGGCFSSPPVFGSINCGDTICGEVWADSFRYDRDWYLKVFTAETTVTWSAVAEFPVVVGIWNLVNGRCDTFSVEFGEAAAPCDTATLTVFLPPGTYAFEVAPRVSSGFPCSTGPHNYVAWLNCSPPLVCGDCSGIPEGEACGADINGGCDSSPPAYGSINCGDTICGTAWADTNYRDTDWYIKEFTAETLVTWSAVAEFPMRLAIVDLTSGCPGGIVATTTRGACYPAALTAFLPAGRYAFFVAPDRFRGFPCMGDRNSYAAWLECTPVPFCETCQAQGEPESEPCGGDDGGGTIRWCQAVCGTAWADTGYRDFDYYFLINDVTAETTVTWSAVAEFPFLLAVVKIDVYGTIIEILAFTTAAPCDTATITTVLPPERGFKYVFIVAPNQTGGLPCSTGPHEFLAWSECASGCYAAKGDMTFNGGLTPSDVVLMLNCVFLREGYCGRCFTDVNCDGNLTPADVVLELNAVFLGSPFPC